MSEYFKCGEAGCRSAEYWLDSTGRPRCVFHDIPDDPNDNFRHAIAEREYERKAIIAEGCERG